MFIKINALCEENKAPAAIKMAALQRELRF